MNRLWILGTIFTSGIAAVFFGSEQHNNEVVQPAVKPSISESEGVIVTKPDYHTEFVFTGTTISGINNINGFSTSGTFAKCEPGWFLVNMGGIPKCARDVINPTWN